MTVSPTTMRTWTFDERIALFERKGLIRPPFSEAERAMAHAASEAFFYALNLKEMPPQDHTGGDGICSTLDWGILHVMYLREKGKTYADTTSQAMARWGHDA